METLSRPSTKLDVSAAAKLSPPTLNKPRHVKYWLRCLKTVLPTAYQSNDTQRLSLAFFTLSALDLLDSLQSKTTAEERQEYVDWIYRCQHPAGGFRGGTSCTSNTRPQDSIEEENVWDSANLAATFFALASLLVLEDNLERVRRKACLRWVNSLQRPDGSFGEARGQDRVVQGGGDVRFCYLACGVRHLLRRREESYENEEDDIDIEGVVDYIMRSVTYEGGIAKAPLHEAHAGETFCGIAALRLLDRLPSSDSQKSEVHSDAPVGPDFVRDVSRWLVYRQTLYIYPEEDDDNARDEEDGSGADDTKVPAPTFHVIGSRPAKAKDARPKTSIEAPEKDLLWAGFNGRCNKVADTCYAWWVAGSLGILKTPHIQNFNAIERYLLDKTQHMIGGFSKIPGDPPDILHSYLGLAALAAMRHSELKRIDPVFCISVSARERFEQSASFKD